MRLFQLLLVFALTLPAVTGCEGSAASTTVTEQDALQKYAAENPNPEGSLP